MLKPIGIYIHIPFCKKKCDYCDFISYSNLNDMQQMYIDMIINELKCESKKEYIVNTVYIGGGTPSYINSKYITKIVKIIKEYYNLSKNAEITIEVNPGTINEEKVLDYYKSGINRVSIGLQSSENSLLKTIGRIHTYEDFLNSYNIIKKYYTNINIDLMIGLPNQTIKMVENTLEEIINLNPKHISIYSLILEENTPLYYKFEKQELILPNEEIERSMYWLVKRRLEKEGYKHYEISNFAKKGYESRHNCDCWEQKEYLGIGLAAHSYINMKRYSNTEDIKKYMNNYKQNQIINEIQNVQQQQKEFMLLGLRKIEGVSIQKFKNKFGINPLYIFRTEIKKLVQIDLLEVDLNNIRLTNKGIDFANQVWQEFI